MSADNSTIVRIISKLAAAWPDLGDPLLGELFLRAPRRLRTPEGEHSRLWAQAHSHWLPTRDGKVRLWQWGAGPVIVLVHGYGGAASQLTPFIEPLIAAGYAVTAYDAPGHGASSGRHASLVSAAQALLRVLDAVGPVHGVIAHSLGGAALCLAVRRGAQLERAVLIAPPSDVRHWYRAFVDMFALGSEQAARVQRVIERRVATPMHELAVSVLGPHVKARTLVVHDRNDREVPFATGEEVARAIPEATLLATEGLGHRRILMERAVIDAAVAFVTEGVRGNRSLAGLIDDELFHPEHRLTQTA